MKKALSIIIAIVLAVCSVCTVTTVFAEPVMKQVVNGDAEMGDLTGWKCLASGTTLANVKEDGKNNRVIEVTAPTSGSFPISAMFDIGALVYDDEANGYAGFGAGNYKVSLNVKVKDASKLPCYAHVTLVSGALDQSNAQMVATHPEYWPESIIGFTQNNWLILGGNSNQEYTVTALEDGWFNIQKTFAVTQGFIDANKARLASSTDAYGLYVALDNLVTDYYVDDVKVIIPEDKSVVNGDAELGTLEGWSYRASGTVLKNVAESGKNNRVIEVTAPTSGSYPISAMFDIGALVFDDGLAGYHGLGAGKYTVSLKIKIKDTSKLPCYAHVSLISGTLDQSDANMVSQHPEYWSNSIIGFTQGNWLILGGNSNAEYTVTTLSDGWYKVEKTFTVSQDFLNAKKAEKAQNDAAYELYVALDNIVTDYYIDDVCVELPETVNGDAELQTLKGWKTPANGTVLKNVAESGKDNRVIEVTAPTSGSYQMSAMFNIGADIFNDAKHAYYGTGAGEYTVSLKLKIKDASKLPCYAHVSLVSGTLDQTDANMVSQHPEYWPNSIIGFTQGNWLILGGNSNAEYNVKALDDGWYKIEKTFAVSQAFLDAKKAEFAQNSAAYELYVTLDNIATDCYIDDVKLVKPEAKTVVNGDAEGNDMSGWGTLFGNGTVTKITDPENEDNHVIRFEPNANDTYASIAFDLGAEIVNDPDFIEDHQYYAGHGAGLYTVSFRIRAKEDNGEKWFALSLQSGHWQSGTAENVTGNRNISINGTAWTNVSFCFNVTDEYLQKLALNKTNDAYKLFVRIDGSSYAFSQSQFAYLVDDFSIEYIDFYGAAPALANSIAFKYYVPAAALAGTGNNYVRFTLEDKTGDAVYPSYETVDGVGYRVFTFTDISPKYMNSTVRADLYANEVLASSKDYSIAQYCYDQLAETDGDDLKTLLVDMLRYGAASQSYAGMQNAPADALLTEAQAAFGTAAAPELVSVTDTGFVKADDASAEWYSAKLILDDAITARFAFKALDVIDLANTSVGISVGGCDEQFVTDIKKSGSKYYVDFSGIQAYSMRDGILVTVYENGTPISNTLKYSVCSYASAKAGDTALGRLVDAMMRYGDSAERYIKLGFDHEAEQWVSEELTFTSLKNYQANKQADVVLDAVFTNAQTGTELTVPGFWDGGNTFKVRFAPTETGTWNFALDCKNDNSLNGISGTVIANEYSGNLDIYTHGFVKTEAGKKYFVYDDGTPFFYLGDTHWFMLDEEFDEAGDHACDIVTDSHFKYIVDKRASEGFTVYQTEPIGSAFDLTDGFTQDDINGFREADKYFAYLAEKGIVHANAALFFVDDLEGELAQNDAYLEKISRYWAARYGSYPVMWTVAQEMDSTYGKMGWTLENNPWVKVAEYIHKYDAYSHPLTGHQSSNTSVTGFGTDETVNGGQSVFNNNQYAPDALTGHTWYAAQWKGFKLTETLDFEMPKDYWYNTGKPAVFYEGRYVYLQTLTFGGRAQGWLAFLNGFCGYGYGIEDIWNYKSPYLTGMISNDGTGSFEVIETAWGETVKDPAADQLGYMRDFFAQIDWWRLAPSFNEGKCFKKVSGNNECYSAAAIGNKEDGYDTYVVYLYSLDRSGVGAITNMDTDATYTAKWFNPRTGEYTVIGTNITASGASADYSVPSKPTAEDWVLLVTKNA